ncbi:hypothetical protein KR018_005927 [Drosophila ironensis]|nr:hypothetical protein KR018_005927 [Drosophila ironensis]
MALVPKITFISKEKNIKAEIEIVPEKDNIKIVVKTKSKGRKEEIQLVGSIAAYIALAHQLQKKPKSISGDMCRLYKRPTVVNLSGVNGIMKCHLEGNGPIHPQRRTKKHLLFPYMCNICLELVRGGVITICGHLFCWICLWPKLHGKNSPKCPHCYKRLILHDDIVPFNAEGPFAKPEDDDLLAEPGAVARPTGLYLSDAQMPNWFRLNDPPKLPGAAYNPKPRDSYQILSRIAIDHPRCHKQLVILKWLQLFFLALLVGGWFLVGLE